eukprot:185999_1
MADTQTRKNEEDISSLQIQLAALKKKLAAYEVQHKKDNESQSQLAKDHEESVDMLESLTMEKESIEEQLESRNVTIEELSETIEALKLDIDILTEEAQHAKSEILDTLPQSDADILKLVQERDELKNELDNVSSLSENRHVESDNQIKGLCAEIKCLEGFRERAETLSQKEGELIKSKEIIEELKLRLDESSQNESVVEILSSKLQDCEDEIEKLKALNLELHSSAEMSTDLEEDFSKTLESLQNELNAKDTEIEAFRKKLHIASKLRSEAEETLHQFRIQVDELQHQNTNLAGLIQGQKGKEVALAKKSMHVFSQLSDVQTQLHGRKLDDISLRLSLISKRLALCELHFLKAHLPENVGIKTASFQLMLLALEVALNCNAVYQVGLKFCDESYDSSKDLFSICYASACIETDMYALIGALQTSPEAEHDKILFHQDVVVKAKAIIIEVLHLMRTDGSFEDSTISDLESIRCEISRALISANVTLDPENEIILTNVLTSKVAIIKIETYISAIILRNISQCAEFADEKEIGDDEKRLELQQSVTILMNVSTKAGEVIDGFEDMIRKYTVGKPKDDTPGIVLKTNTPTIFMEICERSDKILELSRTLHSSVKEDRVSSAIYSLMDDISKLVMVLSEDLSCFVVDESETQSIPWLARVPEIRSMLSNACGLRETLKSMESELFKYKDDIFILKKRQIDDNAKIELLEQKLVFMREKEKQQKVVNSESTVNKQADMPGRSSSGSSVTLSQVRGSNESKRGVQKRHSETSKENRREISFLQKISGNRARHTTQEDLSDYERKRISILSSTVHHLKFSSRSQLCSSLNSSIYYKQVQSPDIKSISYVNEFATFLRTRKTEFLSIHASPTIIQLSDECGRLNNINNLWSCQRLQSLKLYRTLHRS